MPLCDIANCRATLCDACGTCKVHGEVKNPNGLAADGAVCSHGKRKRQRQAKVVELGIESAAGDIRASERARKKVKYTEDLRAADIFTGEK